MSQKSDFSRETDTQSPFLSRFEMDQNLRIIGQVGVNSLKGTHSIVRKCKSKLDGKHYAVKIIRSEDEEMYIHMEREFKIMQNLNGHPNIVQGIECISEMAKCRGYLIMELVEGQHLWSKVCQDGPFQEKEARAIFRIIIQALEYMHERKVVHRDFNPTNVFLNLQNEIKILDFNVSKIIDENGKEEE